MENFQSWDKTHKSDQSLKKNHSDKLLEDWASVIMSYTRSERNILKYISPHHLPSPYPIFIPVVMLSETDNFFYAFTLLHFLLQEFYSMRKLSLSVPAVSHISLRMVKEKWNKWDDKITPYSSFVFFSRSWLYFSFFFPFSVRRTFIISVICVTEFGMNFNHLLPSNSRGNFPFYFNFSCACASKISDRAPVTRFTWVLFEGPVVLGHFFICFRWPAHVISAPLGRNVRVNRKG